MNVKKYPAGIDCVWLAFDCEGRVGAFITAGLGPIPNSTFDENLVSIEEVESILDDLPPITQAKLLVNVKRPDDFIALAERGFFVYDWTDISRTSASAMNAYEPVAAPIKPIHLSELPRALMIFAQASSFPISFLVGEKLDAHKYFNCLEGQN